MLPVTLVFTINIQLCSLSLCPSIIGCLASVSATVLVTNAADEEHAAPGTNRCGHNTQVRTDAGPMKTPGYTQRFIPLCHYTRELSKCSLIENISSKIQRQYFRWI